MVVDVPVEAGKIVCEKYEAPGRRQVRPRDNVIEARYGEKEAKGGESVRILGECCPNNDRSRSP